MTSTRSERIYNYKSTDDYMQYVINMFFLSVYYNDDDVDKHKSSREE